MVSRGCVCAVVLEQSLEWKGSSCLSYPFTFQSKCRNLFKWNSPQVREAMFQCAVWKAAEKGISVQQQWRESREHLSIFTEQHCFSIWCFSALPLYRALPCNSFVLIPLHCQARNPISGSDLCWQGWGRLGKPFSPWVLSTHPREEINSFWKHLHPTERSPESWGKLGVHQGSVVTWEGSLPAKILPKNS